MALAQPSMDSILAGINAMWPCDVATIADQHNDFISSP